MLAFRADAVASTEPIMLLLLLALAADVSSHRCYNCGPPQQGFKQNCDQFNSNPEQYLEECDSNYFGCSIQFQETQEIRQCEEHKLNDCKVANDVKYCYCSAELCNGVNLQQSIIPSDDEDMVEGSGAEEILEDLFTTTPPTSTAANLHSTLALLMTFVLLR